MTLCRRCKSPTGGNGRVYCCKACKAADAADRVPKLCKACRVLPVVGRTMFCSPACHKGGSKTGPVPCALPGCDLLATRRSECCHPAHAQALRRLREGATPRVRKPKPVVLPRGASACDGCAHDRPCPGSERGRQCLAGLWKECRPETGPAKHRVERERSA